MIRTTIVLPPELRAKAIEFARRRGISLGRLIRDALSQIIQAPEGGPPRDPLFADSAVYSGPTPSDLSERHDEYLYGTG